MVNNTHNTRGASYQHAVVSLITVPARRVHQQDKFAGYYFIICRFDAAQRTKHTLIRHESNICSSEILECVSTILTLM
jgi:hypothetical protein